MEREIEFDEPAPEKLEDTEVKEEPKFEDKTKEFEGRLSKLETQLSKILKVLEKLQEEPEEEPEEEEEKESLVKAVEEVKKDYESMSKKIDELENTPARITQDTSEAKPDEKIQQFLKDVTGGEVLVWAEKRGINWGQKESE